MEKPDFVPDEVGVVLGWRAFAIAGDPPHLQSINRTHIWPPRERMEARCYKAHVPPDPKCTCGLYAARTLDHLSSMQYHSYHEDDFVVVGEVKLWGTVVEGTQGWRAQFGYPRRLLVPFVAWRVAAPLRDAYGVGVELVNTLALGRQQD